MQPRSREWPPPSRPVLIGILILVAIAHARVAAAAPLLHPARRPVVIVCIDGLSARSVAASPGFAGILANSSYTLRARAVEHTRSYEGWQANLMGGYTADDNTYATGARHPPLFNHVRSQMPGAVLWFIGRYYIVRYAVNHTAADFYKRTYNTEQTVDAFVDNVDAMNPPDLAVLYAMDTDDAGHGYGWDSQHYTDTVEYIASHIKRVRAALPAALIFIISDHGGRGGGHIYSGRDMRATGSDIDSPWHRDVPWIRYGDMSPRPLCDTIHNAETAAEVARALGIKPHASWRTRGGWLPQDMPCTAEDVAPRVSVSDAVANAPPGAVTATTFLTILYAI